MKPNSIALAAGAALSVAFLWLFVTGVGFPVVGASLLLCLIAVASAASLIFNSRRSVILASCAAAVSLAYSAVVLSGLREPVEGLALVLALAYLAASSYAYARFGKTKYLSPLDMPVYG